MIPLHFPEQKIVEWTKKQMYTYHCALRHLRDESIQDSATLRATHTHARLTSAVKKLFNYCFVFFNYKTHLKSE